MNTFIPDSTKQTKKSLRHVAMVAEFWMATNRQSHLKVYSHYFKSLSLKKESNNFGILFTYFIKQAREIRKFHVVVVQRR